MALEELKAKEKGLATASAVMLLCVIIMFAAGIYLSISKKSFSIFTVLPIVFLANAIISRSQLKKVKEELARRTMA